ncbi:MAG: DUF1080 domain-containing protein [Candidatus Azobacteroides sp.]|nr:DUF1080 domain-containing protein [Candidatus Azobacteroides sp.]
MNYNTLLLFLSILFFVSCSHSEKKELFTGTSAEQWSLSGETLLRDSSLILKGENTKAILKEGKYKNFDLYAEVYTTPEGKGFISFHSDDTGNGGYQVAIHNDRNDSIWWRMTGSLLSVRNLTKSFVRENEWFDMNIRVEGQLIRIFINGKPVVEYKEPDAPFRIAPNTNALLSEGTFTLTSTGKGEIHFRNITVYEIDEKEAGLAAQNVLAGDESNNDIIRLHQEDFPVLDYHVHLKGSLTKEKAAEESMKSGINYAIAPNCGIGFPITENAQIYGFLDTMRTQPFILAMQAEGREWVTTFSKEARDEFDYVFTDALTFTDQKGRRTRLWIEDEVWIEDEQQYMDLIVDKICEVLQEPVDIYVNPCYLPDQMSDRYDEFWTEARMDKFIDALAKSGKALEINELYNIPNKAILMKAKEAGVKFTFGSNNIDVIPAASMLAYSIRMKNECGLTARDMYKPKIKIEK